MDAAVLTLRALWWRRGASAAVLVAAALAVGTAVVGPLWGRAAEESLVATRLDETDPSRLLAYTEVVANAGRTFGRLVPGDALQQVRDTAGALPAGAEARYGPPVDVLRSNRRLQLRAAPPAVPDPSVVEVPGVAPATRPAPPGGLAYLVWRDGQCEVLVITSGACPQELGEVALSDRAARSLLVQPGDQVDVPELSQEPGLPGSREPFPTRLTVSGVYEPPPDGDEVWADDALFGSLPARVLGGEPVPARFDAVVTGGDLLLDTSSTSVLASSRRALDVASVDVDAAGPLAAGLRTWVQESEATRRGVVPEAAALEALSELESERAVVRTTSTLVTLQVVLLAWYVLFVLVGGVVEQRNAEIALGKLRGMRSRTTAAFGLAEPLVLLLAAVPLGLALGYAVSRALATATLSPGTPVAVRGSAVTAACVAVLGAALATVLAARRSLREPVLSQLRRTAPPAPRGRAFVDVAVVVVAVAGLYQLWSIAGEGDGSALVLVAPTLAALAVGVLAARAAPLAVRPWVGSTRGRGSVAGFLASRQLARRSVGVRTVAVLTVAVGIAVFAVDVWAVADRQRESRATAEVGAPTVLDVDAASSAVLLAATRAADPDGSWAMAVARGETGPAADAAGLLAVDTRRWVRVAAWEPGWTAERAAGIAGLAPRLAPSVDLSGTTWTAEVEAAFDRETTADTLLLAQVRNADGEPSTIRLGQLGGDGAQSLTSESPECRDGCRLTGLAVVPVPGQSGPLLGSLELRSLSVDGRALDTGFTDPQATALWRPTVADRRLVGDAPTTGLLARPGGLRMVFGFNPGDPGITRADVPPAVPALVATATTLPPVGRDDLVLVSGLDGDEVPMSVAGRGEVLSGLGRQGVIVDLDVAQRFSQGAEAAAFEVWLGADAPASAEQLLADAGLEVRDRRSIDTRTAALDAAGQAVALLLLLAGAVASLALAVAAVAAGAFVEARRRAYEVAALRVVGVPGRQLRRAVCWEQLVQVAVAVVLGTVTGLATATVAVRALPLSGGALAPPLSADPAWVPVGIVVAVCSVVGLVLALGVTAVVLRTARPDLLRSAQA